MKDLMRRLTSVVIRTSNIKISRRGLADYVKKLHQKACRTYSTIIFPRSTNEIIDLWPGGGFLDVAVVVLRRWGIWVPAS